MAPYYLIGSSAWGTTDYVKFREEGGSDQSMEINKSLIGDFNNYISVKWTFTTSDNKIKLEFDGVQAYYQSTNNSSELYGRIE